MDKLILACIAHLEIKRPVDIRLVSKIKNNNWQAYHITMVKNEKILKHIIRYSLSATLDSERDMQTVIAHEMVHAWQAEYYPHSAMHGLRFQNKAKELRGWLINDGFVIREDIYCADTDK